MAETGNTDDDARAERTCGNRNSPSLLVGMQDGPLEGRLVVFYKTKCTVWFSNHAPFYFTQMSWKNKNLAALLVITQTWRRPRCPLVSEWITKLGYLNTMQYYSVLKGNVLSSHEKIWRKLKFILLTKEANLKRLHMVWFQPCDILAKAKYMKTDQWSPGARR